MNTVFLQKKMNSDS